MSVLLTHCEVIVESWRKLVQISLSVPLQCIPEIVPKGLLQTIRVYVD